MYHPATNLHAVSVDDDWLNNFINGDSLCKMRAEEVPTEHTLPISVHIPILYTRFSAGTRYFGVVRPLLKAIHKVR